MGYYNHRYYGQTCCILYTQLHSYIFFYRLRAGRVAGAKPAKAAEIKQLPVEAAACITCNLDML